MFLRNAKSRIPPTRPSWTASRSAPGARSPSKPAHTRAPGPSAPTSAAPAASAIPGERELSERSSAEVARRLLEDDPSDLIGLGDDRRDTPAAPRSRDMPAKRVEHVVHPFLDVRHRERSRAEEQLEAYLEPVALAVSDATAGLRFEHRGVYPPTPLVPRGLIRRQERTEREAALGHPA